MKQNTNQNNHDKYSDIDKDSSTWKTFLKLFPYILRYKFVLFLSVILLIVSAFADTSLIALLRPLLDKGFTMNDKDFLFMAPIYILGLVFLRGVANYGYSVFLAFVSGKIVMKIRQKLFNHFVDAPVSYYDKNSTGRLLSRIIYDTDQVAASSSDALITIIRESAFICGLFYTMFYNSWQLSLSLIIITPVVIGLITFISVKFRKLAKNMQNSMGNVTMSVEQMLKGHREIIVFGAQEEESKNFNKVNNKFRRDGMKLTSISALSTPIVQLVISFAIAFVLVTASNPDLNITPGEFTVVFSSLVALMQPIKNLTSVNAGFQKGMAACQTLFAILEQPIEDDKGTIDIERVKGEIIFNNVSFGYETRQDLALRNINFNIKAGDTVALVGRSGSGKTTIASLLTRFYDITEGEILIDGYNIQDLTLYCLRNQIGLVSQNVHLFNDTITNNIAYGKIGEYTQEEIEEAAKKAYAYDFIMEFKDGFNTKVGEGGILLSGGQRQRISIARALLRNSPILILDEATSALDTESEQVIQKALDALQIGRTAIVIAHRLSTIENADIILVIDNGQIVEQGNHNELINKNGVYKNLYNLKNRSELIN
ncbi:MULTISPECIES: lipid A export permease/ATP-binding protein MsbA [unclassified Gilliamella]|uniref:lipid A export permease/ATP-binding protein MsbA n=1 Tax=unclassified Gilliamella TaxID=2685620 RepID=UPI001C6A4F91|nr:MULTISPECIES: lipid A export permease/ATP-binding protein MsbA [unclassified Gilliamella]MCX8600984.1 lipid A export permease/ATP-binding protein MsbA [Gilliamella sp. B3722]MCX8607487.1 lipid A export permease/ATP-binding protein MsbA [Gilliamella sp. B3771]MCX8610206.1 lipid A export permease/ATP-binding protein MsbA [Gilliamella sp. B3891]MCX8612534.1 lipid A export permease/ATP-binding protein MsbA [Gilliamella sp. B3773]MCX8616742.1 lipid A export permease/ATP-binding protein MsbA [Gil